MKPDMSIVIPMYNSSRFLKRSLASCVNQDHEGVIETVLVNDGSTDNSFDIAKQFSFENSRPNRRFSLYSQKNKGASSARNFGVLVSESENIFFMDSDDYIEPGAVDEALATLRSGDNVGLVYSDHRKVLSSGEVFKNRVKSDFSLNDILTGMYIGCFRAMPRYVFDELGGYDKSFTHSEDYDLVLRIATEGFDVRHVRKILYNYVFNNHSLSCKDGGFSKVVEGGQRAIRNAFRRLGIEKEIEFGEPWKTEDGVTRYLTKDQVAFYLDMVKEGGNGKK